MIVYIGMIDGVLVIVEMEWENRREEGDIGGLR